MCAYTAESEIYSTLPPFRWRRLYCVCTSNYNLLHKVAFFQVSQNNVMYSEQPNVYDVDLPLLCSYLSYWFSIGPDGRKEEGKTYVEFYQYNKTNLK